MRYGEAYDFWVPDDTLTQAWTPDHPGKMLRQMLDDKGWTQDALATITGHRRQTISDVVAGKSGGLAGHGRSPCGRARERTR